MNKRNSFLFDLNRCNIFNANRKLVATATLDNDVFKFDVVKNNTDFEKSSSAFVCQTANIWHKHLAHVNLDSLNKLKNGMALGIEFDDKVDDVCEICVQDKEHRLPFKHSESFKWNL